MTAEEREKNMCSAIGESSGKMEAMQKKKDIQHTRDTAERMSDIMQQLVKRIGVLEEQVNSKAILPPNSDPREGSNMSSRLTERRGNMERMADWNSRFGLPTETT